MLFILVTSTANVTPAQGAGQCRPAPARRAGRAEPPLRRRPVAAVRWPRRRFRRCGSTSSCGRRSRGCGLRACQENDPGRPPPEVPSLVASFASSRLEPTPRRTWFFGCQPFGADTHVRCLAELATGANVPRPPGPRARCRGARGRGAFRQQTALAGPGDHVPMELRSQNIDVQIDIDSVYHSRLRCPRTGTWVDLVDCTGCPFHGGTMASVEGISVICQFRPGARRVAVSSTSSGR